MEPRKNPVFVNEDFWKAKKIQFLIVDSQTQFIRSKKRENQSNSVILEKVIAFSGNHSF